MEALFLAPPCWKVEASRFGFFRTIVRRQAGAHRQAGPRKRLSRFHDRVIFGAKYKKLISKKCQFEIIN